MKFEYYRGNEFLMSEYPDTNSPAFKISLDFEKTFYKIGNNWTSEHTYQADKTLQLMMRLDNISNGVATFRSYKVVKDRHNFDFQDW